MNDEMHLPPGPLPREGGVCPSEAAASLGTLWTRKASLSLPRRSDGGDRGISAFRHAFYACIIVFFFLGVFASWRFDSSPAQAATVDLPTYVQRLTAARDAINQAQRQGGTQQEASIRRATDALNGIDAVTVDGTTYTPQLDDARASLRPPSPDLDRALTLVTVLRDTAIATNRATPDSGAHAKLDDVLKDRAFHEDQPNIIQQQMIRFRDWLGEQWRRLTAPLRRINPPNPNLPQAPPVPGANGFAAFLALLASPQALVLYAVIIALFIAYRLWRSRKPREQGMDTHAVPERSAEEWRDHAAELAARGEHRAAVRAVLLGVLRDLDERGIVPFDATRTDREYLRAVSERGDWIAEPFQPLVRLVERVFYAGTPCGQTEYERAHAQAEAVHAAAAQAQAFAAVPA